jgi:hypothetical protein
MRLAVLLVVLVGCGRESVEEQAPPVVDASVNDVAVEVAVEASSNSFFDGGWDGAYRGPCRNCAADPNAEVILEGDGVAQRLVGGNDAVTDHCTPLEPRYEESTCIGKRLSACGSGVCVLLGSSIPGHYVDRQGARWDVRDVVFDRADADAGEAVTGTFRATAAREGRELALSGTFRACFATLWRGSCGP